MAVPGFTTVVGPVATDGANGATAYNAIVTQTEANYPKFNTWAAAAEAALPKPGAMVKTTALITLSAGWAFEGLSSRETWGKKWGGCTYVSLAVKRTGTGVARPADGSGGIGNLTDTTVGTLVAGWRPLSTHWVSAVSGSGIFQLSMNASGTVNLYCASGNYSLRSGQLLLWSALFANADIKPF